MPYSNPGENIATKASLTRHLRDLKKEKKISEEDYRRLLLWMDIYGHYLGSFSEEQEKEQIELLKNMDVIQHST
jgi:ribosomal protein L19E